MRIAYCLRCETYVKVHNDCHVVWYKAYSDEPWEVDECEGPFFECEPPARMTEDEWEAVFEDVPSDEEMELIEQSADELEYE